MATVGDRIRLSREAANLTLEDLAARVGIAYQQLWRYEKGQNETPVKTIAKLAVELSVTTDYLLGLVDDPTGAISEGDLSPMERKLIAMLRNGAIVEALEAMTVLSKSDQQSRVTTAQPTRHS